MDTLQHIEGLRDLHIALAACPNFTSSMTSMVPTEDGSNLEAELETKSINYVYGNDISQFLEEARSVWDRKMCNLLESNPIGEDAVPFFDTDHLCSITKLGSNTYSNNAGLVKLSLTGVKLLVRMLNDIRDNCKEVTRVQIVVPTLQMFEYLTNMMKSPLNFLTMAKIECVVSYVPYFSNKKNWYVFNRSNCFELFGPIVFLKRGLEFKIESVLNDDGLKSKVSYETEGSVHLVAPSKIIRATDY